MGRFRSSYRIAGTLNKPPNRSSIFGARLFQPIHSVREASFAPRVGAAYSLNGANTVIRAGAAEVYGHVPLLAADFTSNQERVLNFFDAFRRAYRPPIVLVNSYFISGSSPSAPGTPRDPRIKALATCLVGTSYSNTNSARILTSGPAMLDSQTRNLFLLIRSSILQQGPECWL